MRQELRGQSQNVGARYNDINMAAHDTSQLCAWALPCPADEGGGWGDAYTRRLPRAPRGPATIRRGKQAEWALSCMQKLAQGQKQPVLARFVKRDRWCWEARESQKRFRTWKIC